MKKKTIDEGGAAGDVALSVLRGAVAGALFRAQFEGAGECV